RPGAGYDDYGSRGRGGYDNQPRRSEINDPYNDPYATRQEPQRSRRGGDNYPPQDRYNGRNSSNPYENDWDDDDDEWF
ncbi:MAG: molecular chaperone DnaK, partial [Cyanobacteria bacterium J06621_8]